MRKHKYQTCKNTFDIFEAFYLTAFKEIIILPKK